MFLTNSPHVNQANAIFHVEHYRKRWGIENGYKQIKEFQALTTSKDFSLRYFYFAFACLLYTIWRLVDVLVKQAFGETDAREPLVTANDFLTLAKKFIDPGG